MSTATLHTEMKKTLVPKLRFQEFEGEFVYRKLGDVCNIIMGQSPDSKSYNENGEGYYLIQGNADIKNRVSSPRQWTSMPTKICEIGDIILTVRAPVGAIAKSNHNACIGRGVCVVRNLVNYDLEYIYQFLLNFETKWGKLEQGSTFTAVSGADIKSIKSAFPTLPEQQKIATFLSVLDEKIQQLSRKKELLSQYKKGVMQQLFSGKLRFKPARPGGDENGEDYADWEEKKLGECLDYIQPTKYLVSSTEYDNSYNTPVLTAGKTFILGYTNETDGIFENNLPVIIFDDFTTATKFVEFPFKAKSSAMKILVPFKDVNIKFIYEAMQIMKYEIGGHERHWISKFSQILMPFPCFEEQQKIANFLSGIDSKIEMVNQQITKTQSFKKGLLQQLFV